MHYKTLSRTLGLIQVWAVGLQHEPEDMLLYVLSAQGQEFCVSPVRPQTPQYHTHSSEKGTKQFIVQLPLEECLKTILPFKFNHFLSAT